MQQINFDNGIQEFQVNGGGVLRFNPGDPNIYARFMEAAEKLEKIEKDMLDKGNKLKEADGAGVLMILAEADRQVKELLSWIFGSENNFDEIMGGVNLLAVTGNGERVVTNLLQALLPIIKDGAERYSQQQIGDAVQRAQNNRAQRRAKK